MENKDSSKDSYTYKLSDDERVDRIFDGLTDILKRMTKTTNGDINEVVKDIIEKVSKKD